MPDKPAAEVDIDAHLIRALLASQADDALPGASTRSLRKIAEGWDSEVWRLGSAHAVRLPRRELAAPLVLHEQLALPSIAARLSPTGVQVPEPLVAGRPALGYPWSWSVVPWIDGVRALDVPRIQRAPWAATLARALDALHVEAPADHPVNPFRGRPLAARAGAIDERLEAARASGGLDAASARALETVWRAGVDAAAWDRPPVWIHGDLHPGNLVAHGDALAGIIDFGDVTAGDPAYDLAVAWLAFDGGGRARFVTTAGSRYDDAIWIRARAWAAAIAIMLLTHSDDNPDYFALGKASVAEILLDEGP
ncbi:aminoglycoside phosphotransferase family protein [Microbacterium timonense]|uniref:aminoglycoside phosphotransferase family protein n=1 Tax=Microbacterium timonense TaxID=2086576 RepID=UPI000D102977|nr:aminoglycoside phosphotransferase family protein [Microbacterium timonense]